MKILTWNINGIRAVKTNLKSLFDSLDADVICIQETKVTRDMLDEPTAIVEGYNSYFSFSRKRSGYSGVATFCKDSCTPHKAEEGLYCTLNPQEENAVGCYGDVSSFTDDELEALDSEGRAVITQHKIRTKNGEDNNLAIINVYCPRVDPEREDRHLYKLRFFALLQTRAEALVKSGSHVVVLGDINATHKKIDLCDPSNDYEGFYKKPSRVWLNQFLWEYDKDIEIADIENKDEFAGTTPSLIGHQFVDTFRYFYPEKEGAYTNWCTLTSARETNYGRRLDYIMTDIKIAQTDLKDSIIMAEVEGSDHCPVKTEFFAQCIPSPKCPSLCTKYMPEFTGKQQKLSNFFTKVQPKCNNIVEDKTTNISKTQETKSVCEADTSSGKTNTPKTQSQKRPLESISNSGPAKKQMKTNLSKTSSGSKQANLMNFFAKPKLSSQQNGTEKLKSDNEKSQSNSDKTPSAITDCSKSSSTGNTVSNTQETNSQQKPEKANSSALVWKNLLQGPPPAPLCKGHKEPCVLRTVKKAGPTKGKQFFTCARAEGHSNNPEARCDFFKWVEYKKK